MELELHVADVIDDHKIKMEKMLLKIRKVRKYDIHSEAWYDYVVGSIVSPSITKYSAPAFPEVQL